MESNYKLIGLFLIATLWLCPISGMAQHVKNVPRAFEAVSTEPENFFLENKINVPTDGGHLQGVQVIEKNGSEKLLISGSSLTQAYILRADLATQKSDRLIPLMSEPFRHAGGFQVSGDYIAVGIEDNFDKTSSKVCLYNYHDTNLHQAQPNLIIDRKGKAKRKTAGAVGLLAMDNKYLMVVGNWDSRNWDFYRIDPEKNQQKLAGSFAAPDHWAAYQSINLIADEEAIYAMGFYQQELVGHADLILVSKQGSLELIMEKVHTRTFNCINGVDFTAATGIQVDDMGQLHIWGTQKNALKQIAVNRFSQQ
jgi:hypothetical protein